MKSNVKQILKRTVFPHYLKNLENSEFCTLPKVPGLEKNMINLGFLWQNIEFSKYNSSNFFF